SVVRFLTPTENKRLNELIGFLCIAAATLMAAALISYHSSDPSFNVSASPGNSRLPQNWIGPAGAYTADLLFQVFGFAAFLLPAALLGLGWRWFRSRPIESQAATLIGYGLMLLSLPSLLSLVRFWDIRGAIPAGGMLGSLVASGFRRGVNWGGGLAGTVVLLVTALFMTTGFLFACAHAWATSSKGPIGAVGRLGLLQRVQDRWHAWREEREQQRMRRRVEENRVAGRKPAPMQSVGVATVLNEPPKTIHLRDEAAVFPTQREEEEEDDEDTGHKAPILV